MEKERINYLDKLAQTISDELIIPETYTELERSYLIQKMRDIIDEHERRRI